MKPFPNSAIINVPVPLARQLFEVAEQLPWRSNQEYYDVACQTEVFNKLQEACGEGFQGLIAAIQDCLETPPFSALVKGLQFDQGHRLFVALNRAFGVLVATPYDHKSPRNQLIHYIHPSADLAIASDLHKQTERLHTDCADWPEPSKYISMQCVRPDSHGGGRSRQIDMYTLQQLLASCAEPGILDKLHQEHVPWQLAAYLGGGVVWRPILTKNSMCWRRYTIDFALANEGVELSKSMLATLNILDEVINYTDQIIDFALETGDFLILDNQRCLHARTPITNPDTQRLMLRAWIQ
ncbi:TauD/TfdA family dioxygenase [Leptolyngbya cf. ectocarpi LEGE 11479]|uniref:TauD/TfdA family dioxygenase n=1 Tax=Leptolyngbya cf. ectocarpi LEGE 11479 TaxID=1828722 RepID=A0A928ZX56_LEPEC|nr:TauD/TfdA family dioxygenase [Leptolyngbya ectocarpi]MBE9069033.1 TauD/TfdA family dioxygenase [Leptolyngbya cf. ectocarpi LEGE 11479]